MVENSEKMTKTVKHKDLVNLEDWHSPFKLDCPVCKFGVIVLGRDPKTSNVLANSYCFNCGQRFFFTDIRTDTFALEYKKKSKLIDWFRK